MEKGNNLTEYLARKQRERDKQAEFEDEMNKNKPQKKEPTQLQRVKVYVKKRKPWGLIVVVGLMFLAFITNISETEFKEQTIDKLGSVFDKMISKEEDSFAKVLSPLIKAVLPGFVDVEIKDYYLFSLSYISVNKQNLSDEYEDNSEKAPELHIFGISVFGRTFFPSNSQIEKYCREKGIGFPDDK
jgi:hypothetical protein